MKTTLLFTALITGIFFIGCDMTEQEPDISGVQVLMKTAESSNESSETDLHNGLEFHEVKFFLEELELKGTGGTGDFEVENIIIHLPLNGSPVIITGKQIPAGLYNELELEIEKPDDDIQIYDTDFRDDSGSYSIVVKGTYIGEEFMFRTGREFEIEIDLNPPLNLSGGENEVLVIDVDVDGWFKGTDGENLDPADFLNAETIIGNIEKSFGLFGL